MNELDFARNEIAKLHDDIHELTAERDALRAKVEQIQKQEPICTVVDDYNEDGLSSRITEYLRSGVDLYLAAGAQHALGVPDGWLERGLTELENIRNRFDDSTLMNDKTLIERLFIAMTTTPEDKP